LEIKSLPGIGGWAGVAAAEIDLGCPGFFGELFRADAGRRQVVFAAMSRVSLKDIPDEAPRIREIGYRLLAANGKELIEEFFGSDPAGYRKALKRCGGKPKSKSFYEGLHTVFADPENRSIARVLQFRKKIRSSDVQKLWEIGSFARCGIVLDRLSSIDCARRLALDLDVIRRVCSDLDENRLRQMLVAHAKVDDLPSFLENALKHADRLPDPPIPASDKFVPLTTGKKIVTAGRQYQNCLAECVVNVIAGEVYFYEWLEKPGAIVCLANDPPLGWRISEMRGCRNANLSDAISRKIEEAFALMNVASRDGWFDQRNLYRRLPF